MHTKINKLIRLQNYCIVQIPLLITAVLAQQLTWITPPTLIIIINITSRLIKALISEHGGSKLLYLNSFVGCIAVYY